MTNTASLESCQQLHKLAPGWTDTERWYTPLSTGEIVVTDWQKATRVGMNRSTPLYDTDYLLEKLPVFTNLYHDSHGGWRASIALWLESQDRVYDKTPAEALIRLAITLIQEGKLKP